MKLGSGGLGQVVVQGSLEMLMLLQKRWRYLQMQERCGVDIGNVPCIIDGVHGRVVVRQTFVFPNCWGRLKKPSFVGPRSPVAPADLRLQLLHAPGTETRPSRRSHLPPCFPPTATPQPTNFPLQNPSHRRRLFFRQSSSATRSLTLKNGSCASRSPPLEVHFA